MGPRTMQQACLVTCLTALLAASTCFAKIHVSHVLRDDRKLIPMTDAFGFGSDGMIEIAISGVTIYRDHKEDVNTRYDKFGFFLSPVEADSSLEQDLVDDEKCILVREQRSLCQECAAAGTHIHWFPFAQLSYKRLWCKRRTRHDQLI